MEGIGEGALEHDAFLHFSVWVIVPQTILRETSSSSSDRELPHEVEQALRLLDLRQVTSFGDRFEASIGERLDIDTTILKVCHTITLSPGNKNRDFHMLEAALKLWITTQPLTIVHIERLRIGFPADNLLRGYGRWIDAEGGWMVKAEGHELFWSQRRDIWNGMPIYDNTHTVDQNEATDPLLGIAQSHRRRDPATNRGPNNQGITQVEPFQQLKIGKGEIINTIEPLRTWFTGKARMSRSTLCKEDR